MAVGDTRRDPRTGQEFVVVWDGTCDGIPRPAADKPSGSSLTDASAERPQRGRREDRPRVRHLASTLERARREINELLP